MFSNSSKEKIYCTNVFYTFLGVQGHIICNFWIYRKEDMNFLRFRHFLSLKPNSKSYLTEGLPRGVFWFTGTILGGLAFWSIGSYGI
jgi:hypothetical protein